MAPCSLQPCALNIIHGSVSLLLMERFSSRLLSCAHLVLLCIVSESVSLTGSHSVSQPVTVSQPVSQSVTINVYITHYLVAACSSLLSESTATPVRSQSFSQLKKI